MLLMLKKQSLYRQQRETGKNPFSPFTPLMALGSGILMGVTVAPIGLWWLAWLALAPLWILIVKHRNNRASLIFLAIAWALGYHGTALSWITGIYPMDWLGVPWLPALAITLFCWTAISLWGGILVSIWTILLLHLDRQKPGLRILLGTAIWCALEGLWSFGALWWTSLSYTQSPQNLAILHLGQLSGPTTITAIIVAVNGLIAEAWINRKQVTTISLPVKLGNPYLAIALAILIISHLIGYILYLQPLNERSTAELKVGIVQGNISNQVKLLPEGFHRAVVGYTEGYLALVSQGVNAVLTPEGALPIYQSQLNQTPLIAAIKEKGVLAWVGAFGKKGNSYTNSYTDSYTNSLFTVDGKGKIFSHYDKYKLVPLGEYIPFAEVLGSIVHRLSPLEATQVPGAAHQIFNTPFGRAIAAICYESAFSQNFRRQAADGGEFILSAANDAHYSAAMPEQHHAQDIMRAIETDRWAVRVTNTGYSAFVDPHGRTLWKSGYNTYEIHAEKIYRRQTRTLYVRWGDWLIPLLLIVSLLGWVLESRIYNAR